MADLTDLLEKMKESNSLELIRDKTKGVIDKRQEKNELMQLDALESLETSFPAAFVAKAEVLVGEKTPFEHSSLLFDIRRSLEGLNRTFIQRFKDLFTNRFGLFPNRTARKRTAAANLAQDLIQADTRMIARGIGEGNERAKIELKERKKQFFGLRGVAMGMGSLAKGVGGLFGKKTVGAAGAEKAKEAIQHRDKMGRFAKRTAEGVEELNKTFLQSLKEKSKMGLGIILALIAAPFIAIVAFFKEIAAQIRWMKALTGKGLTKLFTPLKNLFTGKGPIGKAFTSLSKTLKTISSTIKGSKSVKAIGTVGKTVKSVITSLGKFFAPMIKFFKAVFGLGKSLVRMSKTAQLIVKFASKFGSILGKIFLPITILMSAFDFITGFMKGYEEGGILGGLEMGLSKMFKGLIGMPLDLLKSAVSWILGKFGFENAEKALDAFSFSDLIGDMIGGIFGMIDGAVKWVKGLFDFSSFEAGLWSAVKIIFLPITLLVSMISSVFDWLKELFGFGEKEKAGAGGETSILGILKDALSGVWEWLKSLFDIDFAEIAKAIVPDWAPDFIKKAVGIPIKKKTVGELEGEIKAKTDMLGGALGETPISAKQLADIDALRKELETLKRQNQGTAGGGSVNVKADTNISTTKNTQTPVYKTQPGPMVLAVAGMGME